MAKYSIDSTTLTDIANAIREKESSSEPIPVVEMANRIGDIDTQEDLTAEMTTQDDLIDRIRTSLVGKTAAPNILDSLIVRSITKVESNAEIVGNYAFYDCKTLISVDIPMAASIGNGAFSYCFGLTSVDFPLATSVGEGAFYDCKALTRVGLPLVTSIGLSAFEGCEALTSVDLPLATRIGNGAFCDCKALTIVDLPMAGSIGNGAFYECSVLTSLVLRKSDALCTLSSTVAIDNTPIEYGTGYIYVPKALIDRYKAATNWSTYAAQFRAIEDYSVDGTITGALDESKI